MTDDQYNLLLDHRRRGDSMRQILEEAYEMGYDDGVEDGHLQGMSDTLEGGV